MKNNNRYDLSNSLTHFFRDICLEDESESIVMPDFGFGFIDDYYKYSAFFLLRATIRHGTLCATWAERNGRRTIYGPRPAVCFTDMPLGAFIETARQRQQQGQKISTYALVFKKNELFSLGARPVIYGLSDDNSTGDFPFKEGPRIIPDTMLPKCEQYRFVRYELNTSKTQIDWTHEREWRWPFKGDIESHEKKLKEEFQLRPHDMPHLSMYEEAIKEIGIIVNTNEELGQVLHDILRLIDSNKINTDTYSYVLVLDSIENLDKLKSQTEAQEALVNATINLSDVLHIDEEQDALIYKRVREIVENIEESYSPPERGEFGGCWLWLLDNTNELTRSLLNMGHVEISESGKYLYNPLFCKDRSLRQRESMTKKLALALQSEFETELGYHSVLNKFDINGMPFYSDMHTDNIQYYTAE